MDDNQIIQKLHEQVQAEIASKQAYDRQSELYQQSIQATERLRQAEQARVRRLDEIVERYANLGERTKDTEQLLMMVLERSSRLIEAFERSVLRESSIQEWHEDFAQEITEIKYILLLLLSNNPKEKEQVKKRLQKELLSQQYQNLDILKLQVAQYGGGMQAPLNLLNQINDIEKEISRLEDDREA